MSDFHQAALIAEFREPQNQGKITSADFDHKETNASCGDEITISIKLSEDKKSIENVKWMGNGCSVSQTSMSLLSVKLKGAKVAEVKNWGKEDLLPFFGMEEITAGREKCFMMGLKAVQKVFKENKKSD